MYITDLTSLVMVYSAFWKQISKGSKGYRTTEKKIYVIFIF